MVRTKSTMIVILFLSFYLMKAQENPVVRPSPTALTAIRYKDSYIKITYCQPQKRNREIYGKLVPYNEVWRTGANEATEITFTKDIFIKDTLVPAGTYSFFTIPGKEIWTVILNKDLGLWGSYSYNMKLDAFRFEIPVQQTNGYVFEYFTIQFDHRHSVADILLLWDKTKISIPLKFIEPKP